VVELGFVGFGQVLVCHYGHDRYGFGSKRVNGWTAGLEKIGSLSGGSGGMRMDPSVMGQECLS